MLKSDREKKGLPTHLRRTKIYIMPNYSLKGCFFGELTHFVG